MKTVQQLIENVDLMSDSINMMLKETMQEWLIEVATVVGRAKAETGLNVINNRKGAQAGSVIGTGSITITSLENITIEAEIKTTASKMSIDVTVHNEKTQETVTDAVSYGENIGTVKNVGEFIVSVIMQAKKKGKI